MIRLRRSVQPYLAGFLRVDLAVMTTCGMSLALLLSVQAPRTPDASIIPLQVATTAMSAAQPLRVASLSPVPGSPLDAVVRFD
ncbi:MAG: hypothetical protein ACE5G3_12365 [Gammaproteobacteria bacterium]